MKSGIKHFLLKLALGMVMLVLADVVAGFGIKKLFDAQKSGRYFKISHAINNSEEDVLIFGNSHAAEHFDSPLLQKLTSKTVYNFGNGGQSILYSYPVLKSILYHHTPELVILNLDYDELAYYPEAYERISIFLPYFDTNAVIDSAIELMPGNETVKSYSALYRYNSTLGNIILNTYIPQYTRSSKYQGFEPKMGSACSQGSPRELALQPHKIKFDQHKIDYLLRVIDATKRKGIKLLVTTSPLYHYQPSQQLVYKQRLQEILSRYKIPYLDYGMNPEFYGKCEYFNDNSHLNPTGAEKFTIAISQYVLDKGS